MLGGSVWRHGVLGGVEQASCARRPSFHSCLALLPTRPRSTWPPHNQNHLSSPTLQTLPTLCQVEVDFKAECHCGDTVECLGQRSVLPEALSNNGAGPEPLAFAHTLRRCEGDPPRCTELVRMRTVWRAGEAPRP